MLFVIVDKDTARSGGYDGSLLCALARPNWVLHHFATLGYGKAGLLQLV